MADETLTNQITAERALSPAPHGADDDPRLAQLLRQVQILESDKRRWKILCLIGLVLMLLMFLGGGLVMVGIGTYYGHSARRLEMERAMREMEMQQMQAERARFEAERARREADEKR